MSFILCDVKKEANEVTEPRVINYTGRDAGGKTHSKGVHAAVRSQQEHNIAAFEDESAPTTSVW